MSVEDEKVAPATPEQVVTATPETDVEKLPPVEAPETAPAEAPKTFTQEELDAAIGKRLAREQRRWAREQAQISRVSQPDQPKQLAAPETFEDAQAYAEALAERKAQEIVTRREAEAEQSARREAYENREEDARSKYDDFEQVAYNPRLPVTDVMAEAIQASEVGPDVIYWLGTNPKEAERISKLPKVSQAREIGKIEAALGSNPPAKKASTAPAPIVPVVPRASGAPAYDTTDPRSVKTMTTSEWIKQERLRQIKAWEAERKR